MLVPRLRVFFISRAWETEVHARHATRHYFSLFLSPFEVFVNYHPAAEKRALIIRPVEIADDAALDRVTRLPSGRGEKKKEKKREIKKKNPIGFARRTINFINTQGRFSPLPSPSRIFLHRVITTFVFRSKYFICFFAAIKKKLTATRPCRSFDKRGNISHREGYFAYLSIIQLETKCCLHACCNVIHNNHFPLPPI